MEYHLEVNGKKAFLTICGEEIKFKEIGYMMPDNENNEKLSDANYVDHDGDFYYYKDDELKVIQKHITIFINGENISEQIEKIKQDHKDDMWL